VFPPPSITYSVKGTGTESRDIKARFPQFPSSLKINQPRFTQTIMASLARAGMYGGGALLRNYGMRGLRAAQQAAMRAAGRSAAGVVSGAIAGGSTAYGVHSALTQTKSKKRKKRKAASRVPPTGGGGGGAGFGGPIAKGKRASSRGKRTYKRRAARKGENHYAKYGAVSTKEISGTLTDGDCVYLGHSSLVPDECLRVVVYAIVRQLYKRAIGYEADNMKSVIPYRTVAGVQKSSGHSINIKYCNNMANNTKDQVMLAITGDDQTIVSIGDAIMPRFQEMSSGIDVWKNSRLLWIEIIDDTTGFCRSHMDLSTMTVDLFTKSELKIQNVTIPNVDAVTEDNVNNVPLVGRVYNMSQWCPKSSDDDNNLLDIGIQSTGMITWGPQRVTGQQYEAWKEPPPSKAFLNCSSSSTVRLEPGMIKNHYSSTRKSMKLEDFLIAMAFNNSTASTKNVRVGTHDMFALERLLQLEGALPIKVIYECNAFTAATVSTKNRACIMQKVTYATQNSLIPG